MPDDEAVRPYRITVPDDDLSDMGAHERPARRINPVAMRPFRRVRP